MNERSHEPPFSGPGDEKLLNRVGLARRLNMHPSTVDNWQKRYELPTIKNGNKVFFHREDVKAWLKSAPMKGGHRGGDLAQRGAAQDEKGTANE